MDNKFEVFISCKNLGVDGEPTADLALATEVYRFLLGRGLSVFLSSASLENLGAAAFKRAIDDALDCASVLVAVGTSSDRLNSQWVRYEWDSFFNDILSGVKPQGRVFVYVKNLQVASLPRALRQTQCIQHGPGALDRLYRFIINALGIDPGSQSNKHSSRALRKQSCVAISGSKRGQVGDWSQFCYSLGKAAADSGYSMIATDAAGIGMSFCAGALDFLKSVETDDIPSRCRLIQVGTPDPAKRREIRHEFLKQVDACVFVGGGLGTREEYQILRQRGALCIPVGASGGTARKMWEELESYFHEHLYGQAFEAYARLGSIEYGIEDLVIATMQILGACLEGTVPEK